MNENNWTMKWTRDQIKAMLLEQAAAFWKIDTGIEREQLVQLSDAATMPHAVIISGLRRVGKSTLLAQLAHWLGEGRFYYLNFEDDRFLRFKSDDFQDLFSFLVELFGDRRIFLIDEIQNIAGWEFFVRRFMDQGYKFYITGSNASLLSRELGTRLTGRHIPVELFPFSFREFLDFRRQPVPGMGPRTTVESARLQAALNDYLKLGGIPEALKYPDVPVLSRLYDDILYRDIAARHRIDSTATLRELALTLISSPAELVSFNKLKGRLGLGSVNTVKSWISFLEDSWLAFTLQLFDWSLKRQQIAPKKVYAVDTGLVNQVGFRFSPGSGKLLENAVFLALRRKAAKMHYYTSPAGYEVDFYLPQEHELVQVTWQMDHPQTREREVRALAAAAGELRAGHALILSDRNEESQTAGGITVEIRSAAEWLLES